MLRRICAHDVSLLNLCPSISFKTGVGGFVKGGFGSDDIKKANIAPWANVLSNGLFSTVLTDRSLGYTADGNSQLES